MRKLRLPVLSALAVVLFAAAEPARAGAGDCILDHCADRATPSQGAQATTGGGFDFYVLSLSWSAGFCETVGARRPAAQCAPGAGQGFVVHGLWPQSETGFLNDCPGASAPSRIALDHVKGLYPDEGLARHEWRKHGTCSGKSPSDYFADVASARARVVVPAPFEKPAAAQTFSPIDVERAFIAANPGLRMGMISVGCRQGVLEDVKICFSKDLRDFRACDDVARRSCHTREIRVPQPL